MTSSSSSLSSSSMLLDVPLILVSSLGILLNGYVVVAVLLTRQVTASNHILLLHLGVVDILLGVAFLVFSTPGGLFAVESVELATPTSSTSSSSAAERVGGRGGGGNGLTLITPSSPSSTSLNDNDDGVGTSPCCVMHGFLFTLLHPLALWTVCGVNCDRYYAIAAPLHYSHIVNSKKVLIGLGSGWLVTVLFSIAPLFTSTIPYIYIEGLGGCAPNFRSGGQGALWYSTLYTAFTLLLPATVITCCNLKILMIARYHRHRIASAIYEVTLSAQVTITHQRNPFFVPTVTSPNAPKFKGRNAILSVVQLVGTLAILYLPYHVMIVYETTSLRRAPKFLFTVAMVLLSLAPTVNGFFYGVKNKNLRRTFKNYWRKKQTKSELNQEIQARTPSTCGSRRPSLTPLGFFTNSSKPLQRRLSEAILDDVKHNTHKHAATIKRIITADLTTWRPSSVTCLHSNNSTTATGDNARSKKSCGSAAKFNQICQKLFPKAVSSPRITITRTCSDEIDCGRGHQQTSSRKLSVSSSVLKDNADNTKWPNDVKCKQPLLGQQQATVAETTSDSSDESSSMSGKIYMALDLLKNDDEHVRMTQGRMTEVIVESFRRPQPIATTSSHDRST